MTAHLARFHEALATFLEDGGAVMVPLVAAAFALWYALGCRAFLLRRGTRASLDDLVHASTGSAARAPRGLIEAAVARVMARADAAWDAARGPAVDEELVDLAEPLDRMAALARSIVLVAPLLGLLGTVTGMIEMFDSLGSQTLYSQTGGIARGIAEALLTTEMGLAIAIPGYVASRLLDRREARLRGELAHLRVRAVALQLRGRTA